MSRVISFSAIVFLALASAAFGQMDLFTPGDSIIAFDFDTVSAGVASSSPANEEAFNIADEDSSTKYLNFGDGNGEGTGFFGAASNLSSGVVQSIQFVTANDAPERDPTSFELWGTNDPITSPNNSLGDEEDWVLITSGALDLSEDQFTAGDVISFQNSTSYSGYRVIVPTVRDPVLANSMQIADVNIFESNNGTGTPIFDFFDDIRGSGVNIDGGDSESSYPALESPAEAIDGDTLTKYLNFGRENAGFIVTPSIGSSVVNEFEVWNANDAVERDPVGYEIYGTNDAITSVDNGTGDEENWVLIDSGELVLPEDRNLADTDNFGSGPIAVDNSEAFSSYRFVVTSVNDGALANSLQFSEIQFRGTADGGGISGDFNNDSAYDCTDINALTTEVAAGSDMAGFDLTGDGIVDGADVTAWLAEAGAVNNASGGAFIPGDANLDGFVDVSDFNIWNSNQFTTQSLWCSGDFNADGSIDVSDFNVWNSNQFLASDDHTQAVPEPGSMGMMMLAGLIGLQLLRRKR